MAAVRPMNMTKIHPRSRHCRAREEELDLKIGIPRETRPGETRVAATPETVKKYVAARHSVMVEAGAGAGAMIPDADFAAAGAQLVDIATLYGQSELILKVRPPQADEAAQMNSGHVLVGTLNRFDAAGLETLARQGVTGFALEAAPRITRASRSTCCRRRPI